ncbi:hypothetical protein CMO89_04495 [Candidatus Woesearchaeota archaeon]|nr:hypothetical protein [Candidatus Woesearchaeota archaeon]|tara:strand:- start:6020 stop:7888 length:1869 start_codon:yes stop_codon:yes gene_type:complete
MIILTILLFFVYAFGLGFGITLFTKNSENFLERNLMRIGIGMGVLPILGILLNFFHIPLDWKFFLFASLLGPVIYLIKSKGKLKATGLKLTKSNINIFLVLLLFLFTFFMYGTGAFKYPYLEDDDSWVHAQSVKYISTEKTAFEDENFNILSFIDPYPPGYGIFMAVLHQTSSSVSWALKFFNALIISLGIIFFYFFAKVFTGNKNKALFSAFALAAIPCYLSHFIWAHSLAITLFFPAMYCIEMIKNDKKWIIPSSVVISSILVTQPTQAIKIMILIGIYFFVKSILEKKFRWDVLLSMFTGFLLSYFWWYNKWSSMFGEKIENTLASDKYASLHAIDSQSFLSKIKLAFPNNMGTATRAYNFNDFFMAKSQNMINSPVGVGIFLSILAVISLVYIIFRFKSLLKEKNHWIVIALSWLVFVFLGINSMTFNLPVGLFAFRFWMLLGIPLSLICAEGIWLFKSLAKKYRLLGMAMLSLFIIGIIFTSAYQKYTFNTAVWPPGARWLSYEEIEGYLWVKNNLPADAKVFAFTKDRSGYIIGLDKFMCIWCEDDMAFQKTAINKTAEELRSWLRSKRYEYITIGVKEAVEFGANHTNEKINELTLSGFFQPIHRTEGVVVLKVI